MQGLSILSKVLRAGHQLAHGLKGRVDALRNLIPSPLKTGNGGRTQSRND